MGHHVPYRARLSAVKSVMKSTMKRACVHRCVNSRRSAVRCSRTPSSEDRQWPIVARARIDRVGDIQIPERFSNAGEFTRSPRHETPLVQPRKRP